MSDKLLPQVEQEMSEIEYRIDGAALTAERIIADIQTVGAQAKVFSRRLKNMHRALQRNTKRLCDSLDAITY